MFSTDFLANSESVLLKQLRMNRSTELPSQAASILQWNQLAQLRAMNRQFHQLQHCFLRLVNAAKSKL